MGQIHVTYCTRVCGAESKGQHRDDMMIRPHAPALSRTSHSEGTVLLLHRHIIHARLDSDAGLQWGVSVLVRAWGMML